MSTGSDTSTKSTRIVVIVVGVLIVAGAALMGREVLARQAGGPGATPAASATLVVLARAPGSSEQTPVAPGSTPGAPEAKGGSATATATRALTQVVTATTTPTATRTLTPSTTPTLTPLVVTPRPQPVDVFAAATMAAQATADARQYGTPTATPRNMITATFTPRPVVITRTALPGNAATAEFRNAVATAAAATTGTPSPFPTWVVIATDTPRPTAPDQPTNTAIPLLVRITPRPWPAATATRPAGLPAVLAGKILFMSDRTGGQRLYALDPASGQLFSVSEEWPYGVARARDGRSRDGNFTAEVQMEAEVTGWDRQNNRLDSTDPQAQLFVRDNQYNVVHQLTHMRGWNYDPVWSPSGDRIAFVSTESGNDEIYSVRPDGSDQQRLTSNTWEWDKHPSWSPDGKQIVFFSNREAGRRQLWVMNADGSDQRRLLESPSNDWDPIWVKYAN